MMPTLIANRQLSRSVGLALFGLGTLLLVQGWAGERPPLWIRFTNPLL